MPKKKVTATTRKHAFYSPSAAYEWMDCAPSVLTDVGDFDDSSGYSTRGDLLHDLADQQLQIGVYDVIWGRKNVGMTEPYELTDEDRESIRVYVDYGNSLKGDKFHEVKSTFIRGKCGGTSDLVVFDPETGILEVIDYKAGFVKRSAKANYQLIIYALGCVRKFAAVYDIKRVKMTIIQPIHGDLPDSWPLKLSELERWGARIAARIEHLEKLKKAKALGEYAPTKVRCQFCKIGKAMKCSELDKAANAAATNDFSSYQRGTKNAERAELTDLEKWTIAGNAETWIKNLKESVTSRVLGGTPVPGFKIVGGKGKRSVSDKKGLVEHLTKEGFGETDIFIGEPALVSPAQAEKLYIGKGSGVKKKALDQYFETSEGAPSVTLATDPRPPLDTAEKDFATYQREGEKE